jgi:sulfate transport system ATP-binding protein
MSVSVRSVTKRFDKGSDVAAVNDVSFDAPPGKITTLLGPSGSGKSTLLRIIAGLEEPDTGSVTIGDRDVTRQLPSARQVGFVFQSYALFRHMSVTENIGFGMSIRKVERTKIRERVRELLALVQLEGFGERFPGQLSGGQRQRVALARALATNPQVLLLDEPFGALDAQVRLELREWLLGFQDRTGVTTLLVTHDQEEALELSQHVVLLNEGGVAQAGSPHELYDHPGTPFVASFLGAANVLHGHVHGGHAQVGSVAVKAPRGAGEGASVHAYVRPHDVRLSKSRERREGMAAGRVERLTRIGGLVKVSLELENGDPMGVQMPKAEFDALGLTLGDRVLVDLQDTKVFLEDYAI